MNKKPFFSIVIPTYNRAEKLRFALYCLSRQTFRDFEVIISDNVSTDRTKGAVLETKDSRIQYFKNPRSTIYALNLHNALKRAKGRYIFFHSDDDLLPDRTALAKMHAILVRKHVGFLRANYMCIAPDRTRLFYFNARPLYAKDYFLPPQSNPSEILSFLINSDHYFISGLIFKNALPKDVTLITSEHAPWISILWHVVEKYGGYFIKTPFVVASWSTWRNKNNGRHPVYSLHNGKLESEVYFDALKKKLPKEKFISYLHEQLMQNYVRIFPAIKILVGNRDLLRLSKRLRFLDPILQKNVLYWIYLILSLSMPRTMLFFIKNVYRSYFIEKATISSSDTMMRKFTLLEDRYRASLKIPPSLQSRFF